MTENITEYWGGYCPPKGLSTYDLLTEHESTQQEVRRLEDYSRLTEEEFEQLENAQVYEYQLAVEIERRHASWLQHAQAEM